MLLLEAREKIGVREPFLKNELKDFLEIKNVNTFNQTISGLAKFNIIKKIENGLYYFPSSDERFKDLKPSLESIVKKKYLENYNGIRIGAFLAYKYKLTTQVSSYYEIITNNVGKQTRAKKEFDGKVIVRASKFEINKENYLYAEFLELVNNIKYSDFNFDKTKAILIDTFNKMKLNKEILKEFSYYYRGATYFSFREMIKEILYEIA
ncbi:MAG: hypothetical protein ACOX56_04725 [Acholeplasmataceae bacterium]